MKKHGVFYYIPAIIFAVIVLLTGGVSVIFTAPKTMMNILILVAAGVVMQKGKVWGAFIGIGYGVFWIAHDIISAYLRDGYRLFQIEYICIPLIIYYIYCAVAVKTAPENKQKKD